MMSVLDEIVDYLVPALLILGDVLLVVWVLRVERTMLNIGCALMVHIKKTEEAEKEKGHEQG